MIIINLLYSNSESGFVISLYGADYVTVAFGLPLSCDFPSIFYTAVMFAYRTCIFLCAHRAVFNIFTLINSKYRFKNHWLITPYRMLLNHLQKVLENEKRLSPKGEP